MKINVTPQHFLEITKRGYSVDQIFLLRCINDNIDLSSLYTESVKIDIMRATLVRKGLLTEDENKLTTIGQELLLFMETKIAGKIVRKKVDDSVFDTWWKEFPGTDNFVYNNRKFTGCRSLRADKDDCRLKFEKIVLEGEYTAEELIQALKMDVIGKKEASIKQGTNKMTYMQNSKTYLHQRSYESYIELIKQGNNITKTEEKFDGINI